MAFTGDTEEVVLTVNGIKKVASPHPDLTWSKQMGTFRRTSYHLTSLYRHYRSPLSLTCCPTRRHSLIPFILTCSTS